MEFRHVRGRHEAAWNKCDGEQGTAFLCSVKQADPGVKTFQLLSHHKALSSSWFLGED